MNGRARAAWAMVGAWLLAACGGDGSGARAFPVPGDRGPRVVVEVLNASRRPGQARIATRVLRRSGIDVVAFGNAPTGSAELDSTRIIIRRGDTGTGRRVRAALGVGAVVSDPDPELLVDVTVLLGADFAPRLELHP